MLVNPWLQTGLSLAASLLVAGGGALLGVRLSGWRSNRAQWWWRQFRWASELALDNSSAKRVAGLKVLTKLAQSDPAQQDEYLLLDVFPERVLDELVRDLPCPSCGRGGRDGASRLTEEQIAAAHLRLVLDEKLGRQTPEVVQHIAELAAHGTAEQAPVPPSDPPEMTTYEVACYHLCAQFGYTTQQPHPDELIATGHDAVTAVAPDRHELSPVGNVAQPPRFGRTVQQTHPGQIVTAGHDREAGTPAGSA